MLGTEVGEIKKLVASTRLATSWWRRVDSDHRSETQQIYSLPPLATRELLHMQLWSWWTDSNPRPADYKSAALPTELHQRVRCSLINCPTARDSIAGERGIVKHFRKKSFFFFRRPHRGDQAARFAAAPAGPSGPMGGVLPPVRGGEL